MNFINELNNTGSHFGGIDYFHEHIAYLLTYCICYTLSTVVGIVGNLFLIFTIVTVKKLHNTTNFLILNLAINDCLLSAIVDSFSVAGIFLGSKYFHANMFLCKTIASLCIMLCIGSMINIGFLAANRYVRICHDKSYRSLFSKQKTTLYCVLIWFLSVLQDLPNILGWGGHWFDKKSLNCIWNRTRSHSYSVSFTVFSILLPCVCVFVLYIRIFHFSIKNSTEALCFKEHNKLLGTVKKINYRNAKSIQIAKSLSITYGVFAVCWIPYGLLILFDREDTLPAWVYGFSAFIVHLNSALNPILYAIYNPVIRKGYTISLERIGFKKLFFRRILHDVKVSSTTK